MTEKKILIVDDEEVVRRVLGSLLKKDEKTKNIPVLVITALGGESKTEAISAGIDDFVSKPFDAEEISIRVKSMLKIKKLTDELERVLAYVNDIDKQRKDKFQAQ